MAILTTFFEKSDLLKVFPVPDNLGLCGTQLVNYAVKII